MFDAVITGDTQVLARPRLILAFPSVLSAHPRSAGHAATADPVPGLAWASHRESEIPRHASRLNSTSYTHPPRFQLRTSRLSLPICPFGGAGAAQPRPSVASCAPTSQTDCQQTSLADEDDLPVYISSQTSAFDSSLHPLARSSHRLTPASNLSASNPLDIQSSRHPLLSPSNTYW